MQSKRREITSNFPTALDSQNDSISSAAYDVYEKRGEENEANETDSNAEQKNKKQQIKLQTRSRVHTSRLMPQNIIYGVFKLHERKLFATHECSFDEVSLFA